MGIADAIEVLMYAAALDLYRRSNRREIRVQGKLSTAMLDVVDWNARPECLDSTPYDGRSNEERNADDAHYHALYMTGSPRLDFVNCRGE